MSAWKFAVLAALIGVIAFSVFVTVQKRKVAPFPPAASSAGPKVDDEGRFEVIAPGIVTHKVRDTDTPHGKLSLHRVIYGMGATRDYEVTYSDYPPSLIIQYGTPSQLYQELMRGYIRRLNGTLRSQISCQLENIRGLEFLVDVPSIHGFSRVRYFLVGDRLYMVLYGGPADSEDSPEVTDFFNSFRLLH